MKAFFKNILVLTVVLGTYTGYANTTLETNTTFNEVSKGDYISVTDASGEIVYSGLINFDGNIKNLYDFSQLEDGTYTVEVNKDFEIEINSLQVNKNIVTYTNNSNKTIYKPVFRAKDSRVIISKLGLDIDEMTVELYFKNELIHSETVKGQDVLNRVYKLDDSVRGNYTAIIRSNGRVFVENFKL